jgi:two-component system chemotaxis sensor kinase CheA
MSHDSILQAFFVECQELLLDMESQLLSLEKSPDDQEAINAVFRAAHTIKGSAGMFQFEEIVAFTHVVESLLDEIRSGSRPLTGDRVALFLECGDHLGRLVERAKGEVTEKDSALERAQGELLERLGACMASASTASTEAIRPPVGGEGIWHLSIRFDPDMMRQGLDPVSYLQYLADFGEIMSVAVLWEAMPGAAEMDPETCYMGLEIGLLTSASKEALEGVFEFVKDGSLIRILPPSSQVADYLALIRELPEDNRRLGEILVACGALTKGELEAGLKLQGAMPEAAPPLGEILVEHQLVQQTVVEAALEKQAQVRDSKIREASTIRVDAHKLDHLINLIGELVIAGAGASLAAERAGQTDLLEATNLLARLVEEVRDSALTLRMVPIGDTFNRFQRLVRDVSKELGKEIDLVITGGETEVDKTVAEKISDPLVHLIRNAIDHGIEPATSRLARGKPARGTLTLNAYHESGTIVIEVKDDGAGLDRDRILQKAIARGLVSLNQALSDQEVYQLIFEPGFSTAEVVTNLSGRGVGMDVVRRNISALRGTIDLDSQPGKGTAMRIRLPLTLAIIDGFLVGVGDSSFVLPLNVILECVDLPQEDAQRHYLNLRGEVLPFVRLRDLFQIEGQPGKRESVVIVQYGDQKAGFVVDRLLGEFQTVIKPLGPMFQHLKGIAGSTILGNGEVALILDVAALVGRVIQQETRTASD